MLVKPTNSCLLFHYHSHVDYRYKRGLLTTLLDRAYRLSSSWSYFTEECERLKSVFSKLKYPKHLVDSTDKTFLNLRVADQSLLRSKSTTKNNTRVVIPFKDQASANIVKTQSKDLSVKLQAIVQQVFTSRKISQEFPPSEPNLSSLMNNALCVTSRVTSAMLVMPDTPRPWTSVRTRRWTKQDLVRSVRKHYDNRHAGRIPDDRHSCFNVLKK